MLSVQRGEIKDYLAVDTTGSVWPSRQELIRDALRIETDEAKGDKSYGINWKMTAKTILIQMHHKVETLELLREKMVLVIQDVFYSYMTSAFQTSSLQETELARSAHFHIYSLNREDSGAFSINLVSRRSTTALGIAQILGLKDSLRLYEGEKTLLTI